MPKNIFLIFFFLNSIFALAQIPTYNVTIYDSSGTDGYYLFAQGNNFLILDSVGEPVYWLPKAHGISFGLHSNGLISITGGRHNLLMDSLFRVVDSVSCKNYVRDNHDIKILRNGHYLLIGTEIIHTDLSKYYWKGGYGCDTARVKSCVIQEQDSKKNIVFEWHDYDHYSFQDIDPFFLDSTRCSELVDWSHINSVETDEDGNILISARNLDEITKISRVDGSIIWRLGGKRNQFKFVALNGEGISNPTPFQGQHEIRAVGNGDIILLDNGYGAVPHAARALEFKIDEKEKIATLIWSYTYDSCLVSTGRGNVQRLDNSNTLISFGNLVDSNDISFVVVGSSGKKIIQLNGLKGVMKAYNYPSLPWQIHRPEITCFDSLGIKYLFIAASYESYRWNTGDSTRIIKVKNAGIYSAFVPYGDGGFVNSEKFIVGDISRSCGKLMDINGDAKGKR